mmetsp:Transcript_88605/g.225537  ORF Transcript_88605/g.225537 Transcript_88605/m.225537 type:complete len:342 (+) Transcript_88605:239-1264(+)
MPLRPQVPVPGGDIDGLGQQPARPSCAHQHGPCWTFAYEHANHAAWAITRRDVHPGLDLRLAARLAQVDGCVQLRHEVRGACTSASRGLGRREQTRRHLHRARFVALPVLFFEALLPCVHLVNEHRLIFNFLRLLRSRPAGLLLHEEQPRLVHGRLLIILLYSDRAAHPVLGIHLIIKRLPHSLALPISRHLALRIHHIGPQLMVLLVTVDPPHLLGDPLGLLLALGLGEVRVARLLRRHGVLDPVLLRIVPIRLALELLPHGAAQLLVLEAPLSSLLQLLTFPLLHRLGKLPLVLIFSAGCLAKLLTQLLRGPQFDLCGFVRLSESAIHGLASLVLPLLS